MIENVLLLLCIIFQVKFGVITVGSPRIGVTVLLVPNDVKRTRKM